MIALSACARIGLDLVVETHWLMTPSCKTASAAREEDEEVISSEMRSPWSSLWATHTAAHHKISRPSSSLHLNLRAGRDAYQLGMLLMTRIALRSDRANEGHENERWLFDRNRGRLS